MDNLDSSILAQLTTIGDTADLLLCSACNPCAIDTVADSAIIQNAKRSATTLQV